MGNDDTVDIFTDGACSGNPGPGGWAAILRWGDMEEELSGYAADTTNNRMEMMAAIQGVEALKQGVGARLYTDSTYVRDGITKWIERWKRNGWHTAAKKPVKNEDLWRSLASLNAKHTITWHWVKGHSGHAENERVDKLASDAASTIR